MTQTTERQPHRDPRIDYYLLGRMAEPEREAFEREMEASPLLTDEVSLRRDIIIGIWVEERKQLRERLVRAKKNGTAPLDKALVGRGPKQISRTLALLVVLAALVAGIGVGWLLGWWLW